MGFWGFGDDHFIEVAPLLRHCFGAAWEGSASDLPSVLRR
jgi:hypothetical protein